MIHALLFIYLFYLGFALSVSIYRLWQKGTLNVFNKIIFAPVLIVFGSLDVLLNFLLSPVFGIPTKERLFLTDSLNKYHNGNSKILKPVATFVCEKLLNTVDPTGQHC